GMAMARHAVPCLAGRRGPVPGVEGGGLTRLTADRDSPGFGVRSRAAKEREQRGELAEPGLRKALASKPSPETRRQLTLLLDQVGSRPLSSEQLHVLRAVEVLEQTGTSGARQVLRGLTTGAPEAHLTRE